MTNHIDIDKVTLHIKEVAEAHVLPYFRQLKSEQISFKIGDDPVTIADQEAESHLSTRLLGLLPGSKVVGEEAFAANKRVFEAFSCESPVWIIDPIDGTRNFVKGSPEFGVIVALVKQNQTLAGWIYDPTSGEVVSAEKGAGAYYKGQKLKVLPPKPLTEMSGILSQRVIESYLLAKNKKPGPAYVGMAAGSHEYPRLIIDGPHFGKSLAQGMHYRATVQHTNPWDEAAGVLMHHEAGGYSARWGGQPYSIHVIDQGLLLAPDKDSWQELKNWCGTYCELPMG